MTTLYGIKNCDTVRKARIWLEKNNIAYQFHDFRIDGITQQHVQTWINTIGLENLTNKRSTTWKELDQAGKDNFNEQTAVAIIIANPTLIKRPLLDTGTQQYLGFNDAQYANIFN